MDAIHGNAAFDPVSVALLDRPCGACPAGDPGPAGSAGDVAWGQNNATVRVNASRPAMLVLSQAYSPGWVAIIDGRTVPVVRIDGLVQGVPVPAGSHRVEFAYRAPGLRAGLLITLGTLALVLLAGVVARLLRQRRAQQPA
jgi:uncharacterized membrane protein YfhO